MYNKQVQSNQLQKDMLLIGINHRVVQRFMLMNEIYFQFSLYSFVSLLRTCSLINYPEIKNNVIKEICDADFIEITVRQRVFKCLQPRDKQNTALGLSRY